MHKHSFFRRAGWLFGLLPTWLAASTLAAWQPDALENPLAAERSRAQQMQEPALAAQARLKAETAARLRGLDDELAGAKAHLAELQTELMAALAQDDGARLRAIQAEIGAGQVHVRAADSEKSLLLKQIEEAGRDADAWKRRAATLELALRMEMRVLLAAPTEMENRGKRVEAAQKDLDYQDSQIRKYISRREHAAADYDDLRGQQVAAVAARQRMGRAGTAANPRLAAALADTERQLLRAAELANQWFVLNKLLEDRARRNLAAARTEVHVCTIYAAALARKEAQRRAGDAAMAADAADSTLAAGRKVLDARLAAVAQDVERAGTAVTQGLAAIGQARGAAAQDSAQAAYQAALEGRNALEAETDALKEMTAVLKAVAAFAREKADRARSAAENKTADDITQERRGLDESARTSEQYVLSFRTLLQKLDGQVESARKALGLSPAATGPWLQEVADAVQQMIDERPQTPTSLMARLAALTERVAAAAAGELVHRAGQRALARQRLDIAEQWLAGTRSVIQQLDRDAAALLWEQRDPRLNWSSVQELAAVLASAGSDLRFAWDAYRCGMARAVGLVPLWRLAAAAGLVGALIALTVWLRWRLRATELGVGACLALEAGTVAPPLLAALMFCLTLLPANRGATLAGLACGAVAVGWPAWRALVALCRGGTGTAGDTLAGGLLTALRWILVSGLAAGVMWLVARHEPNRWNTGYFLLRAWLFFVWFAGIRLALHPALLGRFLSRRSRHAGLRALGAVVAYFCVVAAILAVVPYLLSLETLARTVLATTLSSFVLLAVGLTVGGLVGWLARRVSAASAGLAQTAIAAAVAGLVAWLWWLLLNRVILASSAPAPIQEVVHLLTVAANAALRFWRADVTAGMTVGNLVRGVVVFAASFYVSKVLKRVFLFRVLARTPMDDTTRQTFAAILGYLVIVFGFLIGLNVAGSSLQNLALLAGAITVGLGFGLQNVINNFVSSLLIHFGRSIRVGDYIQVGDQRGVVKEIGLRCTIINTDDGITVLIPNGAFISANIVNWTFPNPRTRLHVPLTVARQANIGEVTQILSEVAGEHPLLVKNPGPTVEMRGVGAAGIMLELLAWSDKPERLPTIVGELTLAADRRLREKGLLP